MSISALTDEASKSLQSLGLMKKPAAPAAPGASAPPPEPPISYGDIGHGLLNVPFPEMLKNLATSIATSQFELDMVGARMAQIMAGAPMEEGGQAITVDFAGEKGLTLFELGFTPTFYQFTETEIEIKMTLSYSSEFSSTSKSSSTKISADASLPLGLLPAGGAAKGALAGIGGAAGTFKNWNDVLTGNPPFKANLSISTMSTEVMSKYSVKAEGTSTLRTKIVPVPPPDVLIERIRNTVEKRNELKKMVLALDDNPDEYADNYTKLKKTFTEQTATPAESGSKAATKK